MSSTIRAARANLYAAIQAAAADPSSALYDVTTAFGTPDQPEPEELVAVLGVTQPSETNITLGIARHQEEQYRIVVVVKAYDPNASTDRAAASTPLTVDARGWAMADAVRDLVFADITLAGAVRTALPASQTCDMGVFAPLNDDGKRLPGFMVRVDVAIECSARTT